MRRGIAVGALAVLIGVLLALALARVADASLGDRYPPDEAGVIHDPLIDAFVTGIVGWSYRADCVPDPDDGADVRTYFDEEEQPDGTVVALPPVAMDANGAICGALDHLLDLRPGFFHRHEVDVEAVVPRPVKRPRARGGRAVAPSAVDGRGIASDELKPLAGGVVQIREQNDCSWKCDGFATPRKAAQRDTIWGETRVDEAAGALFVVAHDAWHARLFGQAPRVDDGHLAAFDEGIVECDAVRDLPRIIGSLHLPAWLSVAVLRAATDRHLDSQPEYLTVC